MTEHRSSVEVFFQKTWYEGGAAAFLLLPISLLFYLLSVLRRAWYRSPLATSYKAPVPVIVVGNIHVGGTGKTPFIITLVNYLKQQGFHPGVISRGYGVQLSSPCLVKPEHEYQQAGDEPLLIARRCQCPVVSFPDRKKAIETLLAAAPDCDVIISDDGLQHYALQRDIEIVLVDASREFGNGFLLPAGPLRESRKRLADVDYIICNGGLLPALKDKACAMHLEPGELAPLGGQGESKLVRHQLVYAVTGIANPERFFATLQSQGIIFEPVIFTDHHHFKAADFENLRDRPVIMTEKDAVKCSAFARQDWWYMPVDATVPDAMLKAISEQLEEIKA